MTRDEHLAWARERALEHADMGDLAAAVASLASDLGRHPGTAGHPGIRDMTLAAMDGRLDTHARLRECIEGFT